MPIEDIATLINSMGFPIVVAGALFWLNITAIKQLKQAITEHSKLIDKLIHKMGE